LNECVLGNDWILVIDVDILMCVYIEFEEGVVEFVQHFTESGQV